MTTALIADDLALRAACPRWLSSHGPVNVNDALEALQRSAAADLPADYYGTGGAAERLESETAALLGKEAATFVIKGLIAPATSAIFLAGLSRRRSTVRPSSRSFLQTSLAYVLRCTQPIRLCRDWVAAFESRFLAQGCPRDPRQLVGQCDDDGVAVDAALDHSCQPASQRGLAAR